MDRVHSLAGILSADLVARNELFAAPFDLVVCSSVCGFLDDYPGAVALLANSLRSGGLLVQWDWEFEPGSEGPRGLSRDEIRTALEQAGLRAVSVETGFRLTVDGDAMSPLMGVGIR